MTDSGARVGEREPLWERALRGLCMVVVGVVMLGAPLACIGIAAYDSEKRAEDLAAAIRDDALALAPEGATHVTYDANDEVLIWTEDGRRCTAEVVFAGDGALRGAECSTPQSGSNRAAADQ